MTRRLHLELRHADPVTLEILVSEPLRRPIGQLSAATVADMVALSEVELPNKALHKQLVAFTERMAREVADLPNGEPIESWLAELAAVDPARVPEPLRRAIAAEAQRDGRDAAVRVRAQQLLDGFAATPAAPVVLGSGKPSIQRMRTEPVIPEQLRRAPAGARAPREARERAPKPARPAPTRTIDIDRHNRIVELCLERLDDYREQGLKEDVLVAGVKHRARNEYPDLTPAEITGVLRELAATGRVKQSAGRWRRILGAW